MGLFRRCGQGGTVLVTGVDEQIPLLGRERLLLSTQSQTPVQGQFEGQLLNLEFAPLEFRVLLGQPATQIRQLLLRIVGENRPPEGREVR